MAKLTSTRRKRLKSSQFAEPAKRKYPVDTKNRAKNALARVSQFGTEADKAAVRKKVSAKYPSIGNKSAKGKKNNSRKRISGKS